MLKAIFNIGGALIWLALAVAEGLASAGYIQIDARPHWWLAGVLLLLSIASLGVAGRAMEEHDHKAIAQRLYGERERREL